MTFGNRKFAEFLGAATVVIIAEYVLVLSDCVISGRVLGETALGAMNLLMPVFSTVSFFTWLLAVGTSIVYSDAIGRTETEHAKRLAGQGLAAAFVLGLLLVGVTLALETPYLSFMAPDEATMAFSGQYWKWYPLVVILESVDLLLLYLVYTDGGELSCLFSYVGQVVVNIGLSYWLCLRNGMSGISLGTVAAYLVGIVALLPRLMSSRCGLRFRFAFLPHDLLRSFKLSFGDASAGLFHALLFFVITKYVLCNWGPDTLPITAIVFCIVRLTVFFNGVGIALQPLETVYHGEGNDTAIARLIRFAAAVAFAEGLMISAVIFIAPELIISLVGIDDPDLVVAAKRAARLTVTGLSGYAIAYMLNSHYQYVGRPARSVTLTALAFFVMPTVLLVLLGTWIGMDGVWLAVAFGPACALVSFAPLIARAWRRGTETWMRTVNVSHRLGISIAAVQVRKYLIAHDVDDCLAENAEDAVLAGLLQIRDRNRGGKTSVELSVDSKDGVRVILRDDGEHFRLDLPHVPEIVHLPATGFNRNILRWTAAQEGRPHAE